MKKIILIFSSIALLIYPFFPAQATLGLGPGTIKEKILVDTQIERSFRINRIFPDEEVVFEVDVLEDEAGLIDLLSQESLVMNRGEYEKVFNFTIDSTGVEQGDYKMGVSFVKEGVNETGAAMNIRQGVQGTIYVEVVDEYTSADTPIDLMGSDDLITGIGIENFQTSTDVDLAGDQIDFNWSITNTTSDIYYQNIPLETKVLFEGVLISSSSDLCSQVLEPGGVCEKNSTVVIPKGLEGSFNFLINSVGNVHSFSFESTVLFYQAKWFYNLLLALCILGIILAFVFSGSIEKRVRRLFLRKNKKTVQQENKKEQKKIIALRSKKIIIFLTLFIVIFACGNLYYNIPKLSLNESNENTRLTEEYLTYFDQKESGWQVIRLHDLTQNLFSGERTFYSYLDDRFFILPPNQSNNFYLVTPSYLFEYDYSVLPGPIDSISVNDRQSIMLIKGERPDDSKYYCLSGIGVDQGPDCVYLEDLMEDKYFIGQTGWIGDDLLAIVGFKDVYYSYNYWSGELNEIDGDEVSSLIRTTNYQPTEPLSDNITDWKLFGNIVYNWQQKKAYRLNTPKSFHYLSDDYYLMIDRWQRLNLLDLVGGQYFYLNQVDSTPDFYQFEQGYRIDTQAFMLSDDYSLN